MPNCLKKRETLVVYTRILLLFVMTFEICVDLSQGASQIELPDFSKWGLWMTYVTFIFSLLSVNPLPEKFKHDFNAIRNNPFYAWKWFTVLFEVSLLSEFVLTIVFWTSIHSSVFKL